MVQQRTVSVGVKLLAQDYFAGLAKMQAETKKTATTAEQAFAKQKATYDAVGKGALLASGVFTAATVAMIKASADFESKLSQISALGGQYEKNIGRLSKTAFTAGKAFGLSATQVADAQIELAKAGVSAKDILGGALPGALALASAGQIDVAKATSIASIAMTQFGKAGADVPHIADLLAASADRSVASVDSVGDALNQSGLVAAQFGLSIEDTVGTLTSFSKAGLNGSDAGTSFKTMLLSLASPSKQAQAALDRYNISAYDTSGAFVGVTALAGQLQAGFKGIDQASRDAALSTIFGTDAVRAANVLLKEGTKVTQGFADSQSVAGFAALSASKKLDNLNGDVKKLNASFQNDLIEGGSAANDALRGVTKTATGLLDVVGGLPKPVAAVGFGLTAVAGATTAAGAAFFLLTPKIAAANVAMKDLKLTGKGLAATFGKGAALTVGFAAIAGGLSNLGAEGTVNAQQLSQAAARIKGSYKDLDKAFPSNGVFDLVGAGGAKASLDNLTSFLGVTNKVSANFVDGATAALSFGQAGTHLGDVFKSNQETFNATGQQLAALAHTDYSSASASFGRLVQKLGGGADASRAALQVMPAYREEITKLLNASGQAATAQNILAAAAGRGGVGAAIFYAQDAAAANAGALDAMSGSAAGATADIGKLSEVVKRFGSVTLDSRAAQRDFEAAVDDAADAAKKNGRSLDTATDAGRSNQAALDGIASAAVKAAGALLDAGGSQDDAAAAIRRGRKAFIDAAVSMGLSRSAAKKLADQLNLIPGNVKTAVSVTGVAPAQGQIAALKRLLQDINGFRATVYVNAKTAGATNAAQVAKNAVQNVQGRAGGGSITGSGPKGKDSVLIYAAPGEHVLTAREVDKMGGQAGVYAFRESLNAYARGGAIGDAKSDAGKFDTQATAYSRQLALEKRNLAKQQAQVDAAQKRYDGIDGKKKNEAAKKAARAQLEQQKKDVETVNTRIEGIQKKLDAATEKRTSAEQTTAELRTSREDFVSSERRGGQDPLGYIDQLRSMSRDDNFSQKRRDKFKDTANDFEKSLFDLGKQADAASKTLDDLKSSADSMRSSITQAIAGGYQLTGVGSIESTGSTVERNGISFQTTSTGVSADALDAYYRKGAGTSAGFASDLQALAARGLDGRLLAELAGYGVEQGAPIAKALLSATTGQISSINGSYASIQGSAASAAGTVTDVNFKGLIEAAQTVADGVAKQIAEDSAKLRKLIATAFGLTGYAVGTMNASPGLHLVGEKGPELLRFAGGEQVLTAANTRAMMSGARTSSPSVNVTMPDRIVVEDLHGFRAEMRVVAKSEIVSQSQQNAVALMGGSTW